MQEDILIDVQNVSKRFCKDLRCSMLYGCMDSLHPITKIIMNQDAPSLAVNSPRQGVTKCRERKRTPTQYMREPKEHT